MTLRRAEEFDTADTPQCKCGYAAEYVCLTCRRKFCSSCYEEAGFACPACDGEHIDQIVSYERG